MVRRGSCAAALAVSVQLLVAGSALAAAGDLDPSFGNGGKTITNVTSSGGVLSTDTAADVAVQPDGRILVAGRWFIPGCCNGFAVQGFGASGSLDPGFGFAGGQTTNTQPDGAEAIALQPDGKIVLGGSDGQGMGSDFVAARLLYPSGFYDGSFNASGFVEIDFFAEGGSLTEVGRDVLVQPDGKIVMAGSARDPQFGIARVSSVGALDNGFHGNGLALVEFDGDFDIAEAVGLDGTKLVVAGTTTTAGPPAVDRLAIARLHSTGLLDPSFGLGGKSQGGATEYPQGAKGLAVQPDGKTVVVGPGAGNFGIARIQANGSYDPSFGTNGNFPIGFGGNDTANAVVLQPDGKIVVAGTDGDGFAIARLTPGGALDPTFGTGGRATVNFAGVDVAHGLALQPDGKIVVVGATGSDFAIARLLGDPPAEVNPPQVGPPVQVDPPVQVGPPAKKCKKKKKGKKGAGAAKKKKCKNKEKK